MQTSTGPEVPAADARVVCVGLVTLDVVQRVNEQPLWGAKSRSERVELVAGGPAANAAVTAAALLGRGAVTLVSAVGTGPAADVARADLLRHGVELVDLAPTWPHLPVATAVVQADGERTVVSPGATTSPWELDGPGRAVVHGSTAVLVDGHHPRAGEEALRLARAARAVTVLDAGSVKPHVERWLPLLDVAAASSAYAAGLGLTPAQAVAHLREKGAAAALVTDGPREVLWSDGSGTGAILPPSVDAVDSLGAGDAFHGALVAALALGDPLTRAVARACAVAARRVEVADSRAWLEHLPHRVGWARS